MLNYVCSFVRSFVRRRGGRGTKYAEFAPGGPSQKKNRAPRTKYAELAPGGPSLEKKIEFFCVLGVFKISGFFERFLDVFGRGSIQLLSVHLA